MHIYISRYANILTKNIDVINAMGGSRGQMHNILMHLRKCAYTCICTHTPIDVLGAPTLPLENSA